MKYLTLITILCIIGMCIAGKEEDEGVKYANRCEGTYV
jgi:hypothetical protein